MYLRVFLRKFPAEVPLNRMTMAVLKCFIRIFYAMETYIMHFLEADRFLNATVLAGHKVNILFSHLHKITSEPVDYMALALMILL